MRRASPDIPSGNRQKNEISRHVPPNSHLHKTGNMNSSDISPQNLDDLRKQMRKQRRALTESRQQQHAIAVARQLNKLKAFINADNIAAYGG